MGKFLDYFIEKEADPYMEAYNAEKAEDFAKAAEIYQEMAEAELSQNIYSFVRYGGLSAIAYLKAEMEKEANEQLLSVLENFDKDENLSRESFNPQYLVSIVWDLYDADFNAEAESFLTQINQKLVENDCPFKVEFIPPKLINAECPNCQAMIQITLTKKSKCPYCDSIIDKH